MVVGIGKFCHKCYGRHYIGIFFLALLCFYRGKIHKNSKFPKCFCSKCSRFPKCFCLKCSRFPKCLLVRVNILPRVALGKQSSSARIMYWSFYLFFISEREPYLISVSCIPSSCYLIGMRCR